MPARTWCARGPSGTRRAGARVYFCSPRCAEQLQGAGALRVRLALSGRLRARLAAGRRADRRRRRGLRGRRAVAAQALGRAGALGARGGSRAPQAPPPRRRRAGADRRRHLPGSRGARGGDGGGARRRRAGPRPRRALGGGAAGRAARRRRRARRLPRGAPHLRPARPRRRALRRRDSPSCRSATPGPRCAPSARRATSSRRWDAARSGWRWTPSTCTSPARGPEDVGRLRRALDRARAAGRRARGRSRDAPRSHRLPPGEGVIPLGEIVGRVRALGARRHRGGGLPACPVGTGRRRAGWRACASAPRRCSAPRLPAGRAEHGLGSARLRSRRHPGRQEPSPSIPPSSTRSMTRASEACSSHSPPAACRPGAERFRDELGITGAVHLLQRRPRPRPRGGRDLFSLTLPRGLLARVYDVFTNAPVHPLFYRDDRLYCLEQTFPVLEYAEEQRLRVEAIPDPEDFLRLGGFVKSLFIGHPATLPLVRAELEAAVAAGRAAGDDAHRLSGADPRRRLQGRGAPPPLRASGRAAVAGPSRWATRRTTSR